MARRKSAASSESDLSSEEVAASPETKQDTSETAPAVSEIQEEGGESASPSSPRIPVELQRHALRGAPGETRVHVRLHIDASDADGVRFFDEALPISVLRAILAPDVANFFIPVEGAARLKPPRAKGHFLHTSYIREITLLDDMPEEE